MVAWGLVPKQLRGAGGWWKEGGLRIQKCSSETGEGLEQHLQGRMEERGSPSSLGLGCRV
jgi:hypothetical protein